MDGAKKPKEFTFLRLSESLHVIAGITYANSS